MLTNQKETASNSLLFLAHYLESPVAQQDFTRLFWESRVHRLFRNYTKLPVDPDDQQIQLIHFSHDLSSLLFFDEQCGHCYWQWSFVNRHRYHPHQRKIWAQAVASGAYRKFNFVELEKQNQQQVQLVLQALIRQPNVTNFKTALLQLCLTALNHLTAKLKDLNNEPWFKINAQPAQTNTYDQMQQLETLTTKLEVFSHSLHFADLSPVTQKEWLCSEIFAKLLYSSYKNDIYNQSARWRHWQMTKLQEQAITWPRTGFIEFCAE